ncbi:MAG: hypothetical protein QCI82_04840 [Candidatus Thermoplasmatota archaeon]|nr:hypothetical protein [Candidatus Thermoplasmatota archaeon]
MICATKEELRLRLKRESVDGRIPCSSALRIASELDLDTEVVGEALDDMGIKIMKCQLACFP